MISVLQAAGKTSGVVHIPLNALLALQATNCTGMLNLYRVLFVRWRLRARRSPERMMQIKMIRWMSQSVTRRTLSMFVISGMERDGQLSSVSKDRGVDVFFHEHLVNVIKTTSHTYMGKMKPVYIITLFLCFYTSM